MPWFKRTELWVFGTRPAQVPITSHSILQSIQPVASLNRDPAWHWIKGCFDLRFAYAFIRHVFSICSVLSGEKTVDFCAVLCGQG